MRKSERELGGVTGLAGGNPQIPGWSRELLSGRQCLQFTGELRFGQTYFQQETQVTQLLLIIRPNLLMLRRVSQEIPEVLDRVCIQTCIM